MGNGRKELALLIATLEKSFIIVKPWLIVNVNIIIVNR